MGILVEKRDTISFELCEKETEMNSKVESLEAKAADLSQVVSSTLLDLDIEGMDVTVDGDIDAVSAAIREKIRALNSEKGNSITVMRDKFRPSKFLPNS